MPNGTVFCSFFISCLTDKLLRFCPRDFKKVSVITRNAFPFTFHIRCIISITRSIHFRILSATFLITFLTYLLNLWCRVLLENLIGLQLVKKFPAFHGTRRFITVPTKVRHLSLPWASPIQSIYPHPTSWRYILILSTQLSLGLPSGLFPSCFPTKTLYTPSPHPHAPYT